MKKPTSKTPKYAAGGKVDRPIRAANARGLDRMALANAKINAAETMPRTLGDARAARKVDNLYSEAKALKKRAVLNRAAGDRLDRAQTYARSKQK